MLVVTPAGCHWPRRAGGRVSAPCYVSVAGGGPGVAAERGAVRGCPGLSGAVPTTQPQHHAGRRLAVQPRGARGAPGLRHPARRPGKGSRAVSPHPRVHTRRSPHGRPSERRWGCAPDPRPPSAVTPSRPAAGRGEAWTCPETGRGAGTALWLTHFAARLKVGVLRSRLGAGSSRRLLGVGRPCPGRGHLGRLAGETFGSPNLPGVGMCLGPGQILQVWQGCDGMCLSG